MNINKEIISKKRNGKILPKLKSEHYNNIYEKINKEKDILLYKKYSERLNPKNKVKIKKKKVKKFRFLSVGTEQKLLNLEENKIGTNNKVKIRKFNSNDFLEKKSYIKELSQRKKLFSEKVKLIKIVKRHQSPKPREETSFELIRKYSLKVLVTNRSSINTKKEKEINEKTEKKEKVNLNELNNQKPRNLPPLLKVNYSTNNLLLNENKYISRNQDNINIRAANLKPINKRYLMLQYSDLVNQQNKERLDSSLNNNSNLNISNIVSANLNQINLKRKIINIENNQNNGIHKFKTDFSFKEYNYLNYAIVPGNASYLVKNCMCHRTSWRESFSTVTNLFNFKWQQNTNGINYGKLGSYGNIRQVVNHFENHFAISNKANMFINLMFYCEQRKISVFKYVPLTIIFDLDLLDNELESHDKKEKIEILKKFVESDISIYVKNYDEIGDYFREEKFKNEQKRRKEYNKKIKRNGFNEYFFISKEEEKNKLEKEKFKANYPTYIDYFGKPELIERVITSMHNNYNAYSKIRDLEKGMEQSLSMNTIIEIPETHSIGKNMWIIKAINLCQGRCMQIAHNFNQMLNILNKFKEGVEFNFTEKVLEENNEMVKRHHDKNEKKINKDFSTIYCCEKVIIQKYIERPLLYNGRKCDMRIWVLVTHTMKVYFFKEGHLKTCSIPYDIESKDAYSHITNYSFQKHNRNFQKYEKGNEVPFYDFQTFLDKNYPERKYLIKKHLYTQIREIISISMMSVKDQINKNNRNYQFEIFGYDFMLDEEFNLFLIEINDDPGIEESSPWISIIIPRMLDDALRLTIDQIFYPGYDFKKNYKKNKNKNNLKKIKEYFGKKFNASDNYCKTEIDLKDNNRKQSIDKNKERFYTEYNNNPHLVKNSKRLENDNNKNNYITPFPVPGYSNDENLWEFVCNLNEEDPLDKYLDKSSSNNLEENTYFTGIKYLYSKKKN